MRRHSWKDTGTTPDASDLAADPAHTIERCAQCHTERVKDRDRKTLYLYRGGKALAQRSRPVPQDGRWIAFMAGVIPRCVERP